MKPGPSILILGTMHLDRPDNGDLLHPAPITVSDADRQQQIQTLIDVLLTFRPTKVALETTADRQAQLDQDYAAYQEGTFELTADERHQIGFRLARQAKLPQVNGVDWNQSIEGVPNLSQLEQEKPVGFHQIISRETVRMKQLDQDIMGLDFLTFFQKINQPDTTRGMHQTYLELARLGETGMQWVARYWYVRNLTIFKNILALVESSDERIIVIYGLAHVHLLQQLLTDSGLVEVMTLDDLTR